jgi:hypothetical protein
MNTLVVGSVAWMTKHGFLARLPTQLTDEQAKQVVKLYRRQARVLYCKLCRNQFRRILFANPLVWQNLRTRQAWCARGFNDHMRVNQRLHVPDIRAGFRDDVDWLERYSSDECVNDQFLIDFWDDLFCLVFCIPVQNSADTLARCRRIRRYLRSVCIVFEIMASVFEHRSSAKEKQDQMMPPNYLGKGVVSETESTTEARRARLCYQYTLHKELIEQYCISSDDKALPFATPIEYSQRLLRVLSVLYRQINLRPPWLLSLSEHEMLHLTPKGNFFLFTRRYAPAIATHVEVVNGPRKGTEVDTDPTKTNASSSSSSFRNKNNRLILSLPGQQAHTFGKGVGGGQENEDDDDDDELVNPTGCR